ncbi:MAG: hypothetical protein JW749_09195 [Sedimentisphaerales bacterium]|nr:hypothetical protein [Sedimentisphaerales bacterium]
MEKVTLFIAVCTGILVLCLNYRYAIVIYVAATAWYPSYLTARIGTVDFSVGRIVILAVFVKIFLNADLYRGFKLIWLDKFTIIYFVSQIVANLFTPDFLGFLENRAGAVFDMLLPYFGVRLLIRTKSDYVSVLKGIVLVAAPLAIIGFYQCLTGDNPFGFLRRYHAWSEESVTLGYVPRARSGFYRADVTFPMSIMFGLFFSMFGAACVGLLRCRIAHRKAYFAGIALMIVGVFSSMSSGPMLGAFMAVVFIVFYYFRKQWKIALASLVVLCAAVEIASNRHFWDVAGGFALPESAGWYRSRLIEVAIFEGGMSGHWLAGFGHNVDPGWGPRIAGQEYTDLVNHYIGLLVRFGLIGFIPFVIMNVLAVERLVGAFRAAVDDSDRWLVWCVGGALFGLGASMMTVSLFGQPTTTYFMLLSFCAVSTKIMGVPKAFLNLRRGYRLVKQNRVLQYLRLKQNTA